MTTWKLAAALIALLACAQAQEPEAKPVNSPDAPKFAWMVGSWDRK